jgi:hypothetical protein
MTRRSTRPRAFAPDPGAPGRCCDIPGCDAAGEYRAPKSRSALNEYWWFCLDHVRAYNATWDYYRGMSPGEIEAQVRADTSWQRPTWPLGQIGGRIDETVLRRVAGAFQADRARAEQAARPEPGAPPELREPLQTLGLHWPVSLDTVKQRYKTLAKQHHPDANGGDRAAEERLKVINLAYAAVRGRLLRHPEVAAG